MAEVIRVYDQKDLVSTKDFSYCNFSFEQFNPIQSKLVSLLEGDSNIAIAGATSCGKTVCAEMYLGYEFKVRGGKGMYISPLKALAQEKLDDWSSDKHDFSKLNISICTGDYKLTHTRKKELQESNLIVMTSEMLSSRCRNFRSEKSEFLSEVGTLIIDECHLITVPGRGDHLENAIMKIVEINPNIRLVLLSATMPNVEEICKWITKLTKRDTYFLESDYRPCPLSVHYEVYWDGERRYEDNEAEKVKSAIEILEDYPDDKFIMFVHTKRTGEMLKRSLLANDIECEFHNANLTLEKRLKLEKKFKEDKNFRVVIATSTLAWGCYRYGSLVQTANGLKSIEKVSVGDQVRCFDGEKFLDKKVVRIGSKRVKQALKITLSSGEEADVSKDHPFLAVSGRNSPDWIEAKKLSVGDYIAIPNQKHLMEKNYNRLGYILGYAVGDGCLTLAGKFQDGEPKLLLDIACGKQDVNHLQWLKKEIEKEIGKELPSIRYDVNDVGHIVCKSREVTDVFKNYLPISSSKSNLSIPESMFENESMLRSFISGLFDADGGVVDHCNENKSIEFNTISEKLARQVQQVLSYFYIQSTLSKKKMKNVMINGRLQVAKRKWIWRIRIYGDHIQIFKNNIGFKLKRKNKAISNLKKSYKLNCHNTKELIPVRNLLIEHANVNKVSCYSMCGSSMWGYKNKKEITRNKLGNLLLKYPERSNLNRLYEAKITWKKIKSINIVKGGLFQDLEIEDFHSYVGNGMVSHNCNLPARRVVILGVHRGLQEVENYDINQMIGRAGRPLYDPRGDAYILLPESKKTEYISKLSKPTLIQSQLLTDASGAGHYKVLAFHLVSEIHSGNVKTSENIHQWYRKSLAYHQALEFNDEIVDSVIKLLLQCKAIQEEDGFYTCTSVGVIASMFYFSPFDVADLKSNFWKLFNSNKEEDDLWLSIALANIDTHRFGIVNKSERAEMVGYQSKIERLFNKGTYTDSVIKVGHAYHCMLNGVDSFNFNALIQGLKTDSSRIMEVIGAIDNMAGKWGKRDFFNTLQMRLMYGVKSELVELCKIPNIGRVRAEKLWSLKIRTMDDFLKYQSKLPTLLNMSAAKIQEGADMIRQMKMKEMFGS